MRLATLLLLLPFAATAQVGTLDPAFGTGGLVVSDFQTYDDFYGIAPLPDGTLAVVGRSSPSVNVPQNQNAHYVRYDGAGAVLVNQQYNNGVFGCNVPEAFYDLVVEPDGTILAGGFAQFDCGGPQRDFWVHRLQPNGFSEIFARPTFFGVFENTWALARHHDGRITVGGIASPNTANDTRDLAFTRYTPDGQIDLTFGTMGETTVDVYGNYDFLYDLVVMPDGGVVAAGFAYDGSQYDMVLVRLDADGLPDSGFGTDGIVTFDFDGGDDYAFKLARQSDDQLLVVGRRENPDGGIVPIVLRLSPDGTLDPTFGVDGIATVAFGGSRAYANGLVLQSDGKIVVAGGVGEEGSRDIAIARLLSDGSPDPGFGTGGMQTASWSEVDDLARDLTIAPDGDLVVLGITREIVDSETVQDLGLARFVGDTAPVANEAPPSDAPALSVAPNPARGSARLRYTLDAPGPARLTLYDALGRTVAVLADALHAAGEHEVTADLTGLPAGMYLARLETRHGTAVQPLTVVR